MVNIFFYLANSYRSCSLKATALIELKKLLSLTKELLQDEPTHSMQQGAGFRLEGVRL